MRVFQVAELIGKGRMANSPRPGRVPCGATRCSHQVWKDDLSA
jgi:hypothetical protein